MRKENKKIDRRNHDIFARRKQWASSTAAVEVGLPPITHLLEQEVEPILWAVAVDISRK